MARFKIQSDPRLNVRDVAFGARIVDQSVLVPERLVHVLARHSLGNDAGTVATFLASFPTDVAGPLGMDPRGAMESANQLTHLLEQSGVEMPAPQSGFLMPPLGAQNPGVLKKS